MFWAEKGVGAFLNERRLRVSARRELKDALFATGIPFASVPAGARLAFARTLGTLMPVVAGIRRFGAAALDLAWVAAGRYDGYWELGPKPWDVAAGALIVREAGGYATNATGGELVMDVTGIDLVAANPHLHPRLLEVVAEGVAAARGLSRHGRSGVARLCWPRDPRRTSPILILPVPPWRRSAVNHGALDQLQPAAPAAPAPAAPAAGPELPRLAPPAPRRHPATATAPAPVPRRRPRGRGPGRSVAPAPPPPVLLPPVARRRGRPRRHPRRCRSCCRREGESHRSRAVCGSPSAPARRT